MLGTGGVWGGRREDAGDREGEGEGDRRKRSWSEGQSFNLQPKLAWCTWQQQVTACDVTTYNVMM